MKKTSDMNDHECYHMVENLKQRFKPPYVIAGFAPIDVKDFEKELKAVPTEISSKETQTIEELHLPNPFRSLGTLPFSWAQRHNLH
jgi:hypothetical protein